MSTATTAPATVADRGPLTELLLGGGTARRLTWLVVGLMLLLSVVRVISGEQALTSSSTFAAALLLAVPIGLAGLGGLFSERAGVVNIGLEGMMLLGTWGAGWAGYQWGWGGALIGGAVFGAAGGLVHAIATVTFGVDHVVSGVAINILAAGIVRFLSELLYTGNPAGGGVTQSPALSSRPPSFSLPLLSEGPDLLGDVERGDWFLVSDIAGLVRGLTSGVGVLTLVGIILVPVSYLLLWRTAFGLRLRSCGENPAAADSLGVPVYA
jgi:simple sugar transport system permease protein